MSQVRIQPHRLATASAWNVEGWQLTLNGQVLLQPDILEEWDYSSEVVVSYKTRIDRSKLNAETGLSESDIVAAYITVDCPAANVRLATQTILSDEPAHVKIAIQPGVLAGAITLNRGIVLAQASSRKKRWVARAAGSRLLEGTPHVVTLEAEGSRFPVERVATADGEPLFAWLFRVDDGAEPEDPFMAVARVLVNDSHPAGALTAASEASPAQDLYLSALQTDVVRQMLGFAQADGRFKLRSDYPEDSLGYILDLTARNYLDVDLSTALGQMSDDPGLVDTLIQAATDYLIASGQDFFEESS